MITAVALSPSLDVTYVVDELAGIQRPSETHRMAGGKALNAARVAAMMGADVAALTVLGGGAGITVAGLAAHSGVHLETLDGGAHLTRTCTSIFARADGSLTEIYEPPTPVTTATYEDLLARFSQILTERPGWSFISGGMHAGLGAQVLTRVVSVAHAAGVRIAVDSHGPALRALMSTTAPDVLKVNRAEAVELMAVPRETDLTEVVRLLGEVANGLVVVTDGTAGAMATDGSRIVRAVLPGRTGSFPVGSGDSFLGGLLVALDRGDDLDAALRLAMACATANAAVPGAARFDPNTALGLVPLVQVG